jgi:hypothetical protein
VTDEDNRPLEVRVEAAFDRFNRAVILGMEPSAVLFMEALETEGVRISLAVSDSLERKAPDAPGTKAPARAGSAAAGGGAARFVPGRVRAQF